MANILTVVFVIYIAITLISIASTIGEISLLSRIRDGGIYTHEELDANDIRQGTVGLLYLLAIIILAIIFLVWLYRVRKNEPHLGMTGTRFEAGWSVFVWFIPIVNLFRPFQIMQEAWQASDPYATGDEWQQSNVPSLIGWWWAGWLVGNFMTLPSRIFSRQSCWTPAECASNYIDALIWDIGSSIALAASAVLAVWLVRSISDRQGMKYRRGEGMLGG